jgi:CheY-like chemotaxis protein
MSKELKLLFIDDDREFGEDTVNFLKDKKIDNDNFTISIDAVQTFDEAINQILSKPYHIVILDINNGAADADTTGINVLRQIQEQCFIPVIFYSGHINEDVRKLKSQIVGVVTKGDEGIDGLEAEINRLVKFNLPFVKENVLNYLEKEFKTYFWDIIHEQRDKFVADNNDFSLGYLMLRKFGNSLSKEKISEILGDSELNKDKVHAMEFYLYPTDITQEYECGEILQKDNDVYVILTPSCDFIKSNGRERKVGMVLIAKTLLLSTTDEYTKYNANKNNDNKNKLARLIESRKGDRYFFLPKTPFVDNRVIDFQIKEMVKYEDLNVYTRLAKLDSPFAQALVASFIRYYNRIGCPDIDSDLIINGLKYS